MTQARVPSGNPAGGRFSVAAHFEPAVRLRDGQGNEHPPLPDPEATMFDNVAEINERIENAYAAGDVDEVQRIVCESIASAVRNSPAYTPASPPVTVRLEPGEDGSLHVTGVLDAFDGDMGLDPDDGIVDEYAAHLKPLSAGFRESVRMEPHRSSYLLDLDKALGTQIW